MRFLVVLAFVAACTPPSPKSAEAAPMALFGAYKAASDAARAITGDVAIERAGIVFANGQVLYTRTLSPRPGYQATSRAGQTYASLAATPVDAVVEFRRVTDEATSAGTQRLCGAEPVTYVAIAKRTYGVVVLVFSGAEAPSPDATQSALCGAYEFTLPGGGPPREGVVLQ